MCLGIDILGACSYDPSKPAIYFSLGELISVIALVLAFVQLTKPITKFRIYARNLNLKRYILSGLVAISFVFLAAVLPFIPGPAIPLLGYPILWEFMASLLFTLIASRLIYIVNARPVFSNKNSQMYSQACFSMIARGNDDDISELSDEIDISIKPIFNECAKFNIFDQHTAKEGNLEYKISESTQIAWETLNIWSDKKLCKHIICQAPGSAKEIFESLINMHNVNSAGKLLNKQLIQQAFVNHESILMREESNSGLGIYSLLQKTIFGNWHFVNSEHRPLEAWRHHENLVQSWQIKKYCECLQTSFVAYFNAQDYIRRPNAIAGGLKQLNEIANSQVRNMRNYSEQEVSNSRESQVLGTIQFCLIQLIMEIYNHQSKIPKVSFNEAEYDRFKDNSIYGILAFGIYEYLETLSTTLRHDSIIRFDAIGIWLQVFPGHEENSIALNEIQKRLIYHLRVKVNQNLNIEHWLYPALVRLLISINGLYISEEKDNEPISHKFQRTVISQLQASFPILYIKDPEFAIDLLPEDTKYDKVSNTLRKKQFRKEDYVLQLNTIKNE